MAPRRRKPAASSGVGSSAPTTTATTETVNTNTTNTDTTAGLRRRRRGGGAKAEDKEVPSSSSNHENKADEQPSRPSREELIAEHLPPIPLVMTILLCSGFMWVYSFRDLMATGKNIGGEMDDAYLEFTRSTFFYDDGSLGWRSTQGGLSAVKSVTTDANRMGDLFVRKFGGAAALGLHTQKLWPMLFHPPAARWGTGHYAPLLITAVLCNLALVVFWGWVREELSNSGAHRLPTVFVAVLLLEAVVMGGYVMTATLTKPTPTTTPTTTTTAIPSRIVMRTVSIVSGLIGLVAARDLWFPGRILTWVPRDDIYLEWTGALLHSPPEGSPEHWHHGLEAALYVPNRIVSQLTALHLLLGCLYKFVTAFCVRNSVVVSTKNKKTKTKKNTVGDVQCRMIWRGQAFADGLLLFVLRIFSSAAKTASLDLRWHLMFLAYETFILSLFAFW